MEKKPRGFAVRFTLRRGCDTDRCSIDVRGQLRKKKEQLGDLELKEGECGDTYRAENDSAEGFDE